MSSNSVKITAVTVAQAAKILSTASSRRVEPAQIERIATALGVLRPDGTFSLMDYVATLAREVTRGD